MKPFNLFLNEINEGQTLAALTGDFAELLQAVQAQGRGGSITLKIKVNPTARGNQGHVDKVTITAERKLELPKPEQPQDFFWLTDSAEPTRQHPRQQELALQGVRTLANLTPTQAFSAPDADGVIEPRTLGGNGI